MFRVQKMKKEDTPAAAELANTMDWNMTIEDFQFNMKMEPNGCLVLKENAKVIGIATCINYGKVGWFGNLIVEEAYRKHGAGTLLVEHAKTYLKDNGVTTIGLYAYQHLIHFYESMGFKSFNEFALLKSEQPSKEEPLKTKTRLRNAKKTDAPAVIDLDEKCFGASRKKLLEPILNGKNNRSLIVEKNGKNVGFLVVNSYDNLAEVGPMTCERKNVETAKELLSAVLNDLNSSEVYMCLPTSEKELLKIAANFRFKEEFKVTRMFLGPPIQTDCIYIAESLERG